MSILLVRHGETLGNAARIMQLPDVPLNDRGIRQAELLADRLTALGFAHVLCSDLLRAQMTAAPLARRSGLMVEETALLQERNFGDLRGRAYADLASDPFAPDYVPPNGESWAAFRERVARAFAWIIARRSQIAGDLVVVTHGLVCRALVEAHARCMPGELVPARFDNASLTILDADPPHALRLLNCTRHLEEARSSARQGGAA